MKKLHFSNDNGGPVCKVRKDHKFETTSNLDDVNCRSCIRWEAHVRHDISLFARFYA